MAALALYGQQLYNSGNVEEKEEMAVKAPHTMSLGFKEEMAVKAPHTMEPATEAC